MSGELVREVLDHAPEDLAPSQLVVLLVIAERSQPHSRTVGGRTIRARECFPERGDMQRDCRMSEATLSKTLQRLAHRGLEVRVPLGEDKIGRPYFARAGHRTTYRLPVLEGRADTGPPSQGVADADDPPVAGAGRTPVRPEGGRPSGHRRTPVRPEGGPLSGPNRNVTGSEPEREPDSDRWRDRDSDAVAVAMSIPAGERSEVDLEGLLERVAESVDGLSTAEESTARGMFRRGSVLAAVVNKVKRERARLELRALDGRSA